MPKIRGRSWNDTIGRWNVKEISGDTWSRPRFNLMTITWVTAVIATITMSRGCWISWWQLFQCRYRACRRSAVPNPGATCHWTLWCLAFCSAKVDRENFLSLRVTNSWHALAGTQASLKQKRQRDCPIRELCWNRTWRTVLCSAYKISDITA